MLIQYFEREEHYKRERERFKTYCDDIEKYINCSRPSPALDKEILSDRESRLQALFVKYGSNLKLTNTVNNYQFALRSKSGMSHVDFSPNPGLDLLFGNEDGKLPIFDFEKNPYWNRI